ncbi:hypothetical protein BBK36DRAFT_1198760 [Trichoderma citrinoviride]|uniref:DUF7730 domain-containing protein n=1 Tax=Trichoderma citrinoviride TaxID=58853 RepID=A0A2T4BC30_9HYPO|nr:hypothetical protein BBK36DRAFT_1198760 [Trichoderma citrinoviride]PTB66884.1 hypothetical protein BBK36DRAFT_1198760 [Trichoderma citrinoviride]
MPNALVSWFRRRRVARSNRKRASSGSSLTLPPLLIIDDPPIPPHPRLPSQRRGRLTPTPSHESLVAATNAATADSPFFTRLPLEIRRKILVEAFGAQTVHMDLIYDHPAQQQQQQPLQGVLRPRAHGNLSVRLSTGVCDARNLRLDDSRPKEWAWRSSVCHRNPPGRCRPGEEVQPAEDYCRFGQSPWHYTCRHWPGEFPTKCLVGAMGWLCSCRQAYIEGIDVLYATNTFHTASKEMILSLSSILLPQRLASITSVELLWDFAPFPSIHPEVVKPPLSDMASFRLFLDAVPATFPAARKLHISLQGRLYPTRTVNGLTRWDSSVDRTDEILRPVDDLVSRLGPHVTDFSLGIPSSLYQDQRDRALKNGDPVEQAHKGRHERHWRPLEGDGERRTGYWVWLGKKDFTIPYTCSIGEGAHDVIGEENWVLYRVSPY